MCHVLLSSRANALFYSFNSLLRGDRTTLSSCFDLRFTVNDYIAPLHSTESLGYLFADHRAQTIVMHLQHRSLTVSDCSIALSSPLERV